MNKYVPQIVLPPLAGAFVFAALHLHDEAHLPGNSAPISLPMHLISVANVATTTSNVATVTISSPPGAPKVFLTGAEEMGETSWETHHGFGSDS